MGSIFLLRGDDPLILNYNWCVICIFCHTYVHSTVVRVGIHAEQQGGRLRPKSHWGEPSGDVWSRLESGQRRAGYGTCVAWWTEEAVLYLPPYFGTLNIPIVIFFHLDGHNRGEDASKAGAQEGVE